MVTSERPRAADKAGGGGGEQRVLNVVFGPESVHPHQHRPLAVEVDQWLGLGVVELESSSDGFLGVVLTTAGTHALDDNIRRNIEIDHDIDGVRFENPVEFECLLLGPRKPVEHKPGLDLRRVLEPLVHHCDHQLVGHQFAAIHERLRLESGGHPGRGRIPKHLTG